MGLLGVYWLVGLVDSRTPLLVADAQGIRIRLGRTWRGLPWTRGAPRRAHPAPRPAARRPPGRGAAQPRAHRGRARPARGKRHTSLSRLLHGAPLAVPLGLSTRVVGRRGTTSPRPWPGSRATPTRSWCWSPRPTSRAAEDEVDDADVDVRGRSSRRSRSLPPSSPARRPAALRETGPARRSEVRREVVDHDRRRARGPRAAPSRPGQPGRGDPVVGRPRPCDRPPGRAGRAAGARRLRGRARRGPGHRARARRRAHPPGPERRPARRPHPHPSARDRGRRGRRLRAVRRRLLRPRPPAHAGPRARRSTSRPCSRRTTSATPTPRSTRAASSRPSWPPVRTARSAAPAAAPTGRCWWRS